MPSTPVQKPTQAFLAQNMIAGDGCRGWLGSNPQIVGPGSTTWDIPKGTGAHRHYEGITGTAVSPGVGRGAGFHAEN
jgi:hypothetical protein